MSTISEEQKATPDPDNEFDELTGVYGFFRRHQKLLLYTAGLFTLLTFSITGPMTQLFTGLFSEEREFGSIVVQGERVELTGEDYDYGTQLARNVNVNVSGGLPYGVLLPVRAGEGGDSELGEVFAIMRRAAITEGIETSFVEVDRAIEATRELAKAESAAKLARQRGFASLAEFRLLVAEALRIGAHMRLQMLALDTSEAEMMRQLLLYREKVSFRVATFDEKARQEELAAATELTDEDLNKWLDEQNDFQKRRMGAYDLPIVQLRFAALLLDEGQFDPEQWQDTYLTDFAMSEDQLAGVYEQVKEQFKVPDSEDEYTPFDDEAVQAKLLRIVQAEKVMSELLAKLKEQQIESVKPFTEAVEKAQADVAEAQQAEGKARQEMMAKERELNDKKAELDKDPENEELKAAVATLETEHQAAKDAHFAAEPVLTQMKNTLEEARTAENDARANFDFKGSFDAMVAGKTGFVHKENDKKLTAEELKDLDGLGLELGTWDKSTEAAGLPSKGTLANGPGRTTKAIVIYQAIDVDPQPLKAWDELKDLVKDAYWTQKAQEEGREKRKQMDETLLRLAKEKMAEFVAEREGDRDNRVNTKVTEWETGLTEGIAKAQQKVDSLTKGTNAYEAWERDLNSKKTQLEGKDARVKMFEKQVDREIENEIKEEARKHYGDVLEAAANEVGFTVSTVGPHPKNLSSQPRFADRFDENTVFVFQRHAEMKEGEAVGPVVDTTERRIHVIACTKVEPMTAADVTRREFEQVRRQFNQLQSRNALIQAFTQEALAERYQLEKPVGELVEPSPQ